jgi:hypothetical protein
MLFVINERKWGGEEHKMRSLLPCFHYTTWLLVTVWGNKCSNYWVFSFPFYCFVFLLVWVFGQFIHILFNIINFKINNYIIFQLP